MSNFFGGDYILLAEFIYHSYQLGIIEGIERRLRNAGSPIID